MNFTLEAPVHYTVVDKSNPIMKDMTDLTITDEAFFSMTWAKDPGIHVLANAEIAPTRSAGDHKGEIVPQMWTYEHTVAGGQPARAFVWMQGHTYSNFAMPEIQKTLLRGIAWAGKKPVDELVKLCGARRVPLAPQRVEAGRPITDDATLWRCRPAGPGRRRAHAIHTGPVEGMADLRPRFRRHALLPADRRSRPRMSASSRWRGCITCGPPAPCSRRTDGGARGGARGAGRYAGPLRPRRTRSRRRGGGSGFRPSEVTPLVINGTMYLSTPYSRVVAVDPTTGKEIWAFQLPARQPFHARRRILARRRADAAADRLRLERRQAVLAQCEDRQAQRRLSAITASST